MNILADGLQALAQGLDAAGSCTYHAPLMASESSDQSLPPAPPRRRAYYLAPNLLTTGCLFSGFYAIVAAIDGNFERAGMGVFIAMLFDGLDGRVARLMHAESAFGKEYDSLADMVAFGVAPAIVSYQWGVARITEYGGAWGRLGWLAAFFYCVAAGLRLARFNTRVGGNDKRYFEGLPSPSAAALVSGFIWSFNEWREPGLTGLVVAFTVTALAGALMVSPFSYPSFKNIDLTKPVRFVSLVALVVIPFLVIAGDPSRALLLCFGSYGLIPPLVWIWRRLRRRQRGERPSASA